MTAERLRLGERLVEHGVISSDQLAIALREQRNRAEPLGAILVRLGFVGESVLRTQLGEASGHDSIDLARVIPEPLALRQVPREFAHRHRLLPVTLDAPAQRLLVAMADPSDLLTLDRLRARTGVEPEARLVGGNEITRAIALFYDHEHSLDGIMRELDEGGLEATTVREDAGDYEQPIVRLVDALLVDAVRRGASDIHLEPEPGFVRIRYRIDGILQAVRSLHADHGAPLGVRIKVMAGMDIAETRAPQDGRFDRWVGGRMVDFRVSVVRTLHGENIVLRILDRGAGLRRIDELGLTPAAIDSLRLMLARPEGLILVTGPTGSGKTTTLYSMLGEQNSEAVNIVTLEDPVEYPLPRVRQSSVQAQVGMDFADGVRSLMRQDPDIMLIGEIRDADTATMALRAAMTGHQVYSTVHARSAVAAIPRLVEIGISPQLLAGNLTGVIGQRLVRRLCPHCSDTREPGRMEQAMLQAAGESMRTIRVPVGCVSCAYQGYAGRVALFEILRVDDEIDAAIADRPAVGALRHLIERRGFTDLAADAFRHVRAGTTSLAEAARVVDLTGDVRAGTVGS